MTLVVDASVACKWIFREAGTEAAQSLLATDQPLIAPDLILAEVANVAWRRVRMAEIGREQAAAGYQAVETCIDKFVPTRTLTARALDIALELDHPVYDCLYLALAEADGAGLTTDDRRLLEKVDGTRWSVTVMALERVQT